MQVITLFMRQIQRETTGLNYDRLHMLCRPNKLIKGGKCLFLQFKRNANWVSDMSSLFRTDQTNAGTLSLSSLIDKPFPFIEAPGPF